MKKFVEFAAQLFLIWLVYAVSDYIVKLVQLPIPASVFGLIVLYALLVSGIIKIQYIERGATFLNRHLAFFFVPIAVGLMNYGGLIKTNGLQWLGIILGSSIIGLLVSGFLTQYLSKVEKEDHKHEQSHSI
ncbi:CidA/LrgA family protein [Bacillus salinus]|uniref:CidA/LrgA family protein n=1 Tax=Bacillus sp. HMF5848 TaxID=2495421 RepID=UPI0021AD7EA1|nr:CidA/LrgA family protein [Bacillus sp. HMF5848]